MHMVLLEQPELITTDNLVQQNDTLSFIEPTLQATLWLSFMKPDKMSQVTPVLPRFLKQIVL